MGKPRMYGMNKPFVPNNKRRDTKNRRKGKKK